MSECYLKGEISDLNEINDVNLKNARECYLWWKDRWADKRLSTLIQTNRIKNAVSKRSKILKFLEQELVNTSCKSSKKYQIRKLDLKFIRTGGGSTGTFKSLNELESCLLYNDNKDVILKKK